MTPRDAVLALSDNIEKRLKAEETRNEDYAKDYALRAIVQGEESAAQSAKEYYAKAKVYEETIKLVRDARQEMLRELSKPEVP